MSWQRTAPVLVGPAALACCLLFPWPWRQQGAQGATAAADDNLVIIRGQRPEQRRSTTGQRLSVKPSDASRFDSASHLKRESSLLPAETGQIKASGFVVPRVRGQEAKLTDVYLEGIALHDPYTGLPFIEDLDLRAFGELEVIQGFAPLDLPGLNPIGSLHYRIRPVASNSLSFGGQTGASFGQSAWVLAQAKHMGAAATSSARLYARTHQSNGRYRYYSDEGTPYSTVDDRWRWRENNQSQSRQLVPVLQYQQGPWQLMALAWAHDSQRGLPSPSPLVSSTAEVRSFGQTASLRVSYQHRFSQEVHTSFSLGLVQSADERRLSDAAQQFLLTADESVLALSSQRGQAQWQGQVANLRWQLAYEKSQALVRSTLGQRLAASPSRLTEGLVGGLRYSAGGIASIEAKAMHRRHQAEVVQPLLAAWRDAAEDEETAHEQTAAGASLSIALHPTPQGSVYAQLGHNQRLPSLMESYGDGATLRANDELKPEATGHREAGAFYVTTLPSAIHLRVETAVYEDLTRDKIVVVPVMAAASKALNVHTTQVRGWDQRLSLSLEQSRLSLSHSRLWPYNTTRPQLRQQLPAVPTQVWVGEAEQGLGPWTLRWLSRYRSAVYRDLANSVVLPGAWVHDCSADLNLKSLWFTNDALALGLSVRNVFNLMAVPISAPQSPSSRGMTAYSDTAGFPLPGRQWVLSLAYTLS